MTKLHSLFKLIFISLLAVSSNILADETVVSATETSSDTPTDSPLISASGKKQKRKSKVEYVTYSRVPSFRKTSDFESTAAYAANWNAGYGMIYFANTRGNLTFNDPGAVPNPGEINNKPGRRWKHNNTALFEGALTWNVGGTTSKMKWLGLGLSYQHQANIEMYFQNIYPTTVIPDQTYGIDYFETVLSLDAICAKVYLYNPISMLFKGLLFSSYAAFSVGPSWQTYRNINYIDIVQGQTTPYNTKITANCFFGSEIAIKIRGLLIGSNISAIAGIKFNLWGQSGNLGSPQDQDERGIAGASFGFRNPINIETVYQWAPFGGIQISY